METAGNISFSVLGILSPLAIRKVIFVTDVPHALRTEVLAQHILGKNFDTSVSIAPWPLSEHEKALELQKEQAGLGFVEKLMSEVPAGDPTGAISWISHNHAKRPYYGWGIREITAALRGQLLDFNPQPADSFPREHQTFI